MTGQERAQLLKAKARELGFELSGVASASPSPDFPFFLEWLQKGHAGEMGYLQRRQAERGNPDLVLPGARFIFSVALSYNPREADYPLLEKHPVSCYAWGRDYHEVLGEKLEKLSALLLETAPGAKAKCYVDTGPVLEKSYAAAAGLGWIGKNTLLLNKRFGSFLFLGEILTDAELLADEPAENLCRSCTACLDACPTGALEEPGLLNATKCISYLTLEHRSDFKEAPRLKGYLAGCDLCQTACPYNQQAPAGREPAFLPRPEILALTAEKAAALSEAEFKTFTRHSALERIKYPMWKRNAAERNP
ncbi:MAG TPA: tRNA epoxyqueuosine(34) reductase QueG [bacterium]|nr:tRNA epoxyqueuosine(34) reductase QueG [bacterium]